VVNTSYAHITGIFSAPQSSLQSSAGATATASLDIKTPVAQQSYEEIKIMNSTTSAIWGNHVAVPDGPDGFTVRTTFPVNPDGVEVMLEQWEAGTEEPPHSHPGDDMTVVVEGRMVIQFFLSREGRLRPDGDPVVLNHGDTGYVKAGRIHDAKYLQACKLVYVHNRAFGFTAAG
jgi:quercetin dioxygenase-like cupin family protein